MTDRGSPLIDWDPLIDEGYLVNGEGPSDEVNIFDRRKTTLTERRPPLTDRGPILIDGGPI